MESKRGVSTARPPDSPDPSTDRHAERIAPRQLGVSSWDLNDFGLIRADLSIRRHVPTGSVIRMLGQAGKLRGEKPRTIRFVSGGRVALLLLRPGPSLAARPTGQPWAVTVLQLAAT